MQYILFLRGVNTGGKIVKMAELQEVLQKAGFTSVQTVLQTGNIILEANRKSPNKLSAELEGLLEKHFGFQIKILALTPGELDQIVAACPFSTADPQLHRYIIFSRNNFEEKMANEGPTDAEIEKTTAGTGVVYWQVAKGRTLDSLFGKYLEKAARKEFVTTRNINTVQKILDKCTLP